MQLLIVEDDKPLARSLQKALRGHGFAVNHVETGSAALEALAMERPDMMIIDLGLPDTDGLTLLRTIRRSTPDLPILLLTARDTVQDKVQGLNDGADDYLSKPFDMTELLARLRVMERRLSKSGNPVLAFGDLELDTMEQKVRYKGENVETSRREYMLLKSLIETPGRVLTRAALEGRLYSWDEEISSNAIEVHVHHLRRKLDNGLIRTIRGVGYQLSEPQHNTPEA